MTVERPGVGLIGAGAAGSSMILALHRQGYPVLGVASRSDDSAKRCAEWVGCIRHGNDNAAIASLAELVIIATPDDQIETVAGEIAESGLVREQQLYLHLSGALGSECLAPLARQGADTLSLHPIQTLSDPRRGAEMLRGIHFCLEGGPRALARGRSLVGALGGRTLVVPGERKPLYHAALCMASNYLVALEHLAESLMLEAGVDPGDALPALLPLIRGSIGNLERQGTTGALTGPLSRGDASTIEAHLKGLGVLGGEQERVYRMLGKVCVELARKKGRADPDGLKAIEAMLDD